MRALNEWEPRATSGQEWRGNLETQKAALFATQIKNNNVKLARWTYASMLGGNTTMKLGCV